VQTRCPDKQQIYRLTLTQDFKFCDPDREGSFL